MKKFEDIASEAQRLQGEVSGNEKRIEVKFTEIERRLGNIEGDLKDMHNTIEKIWLNMSKRRQNHGE